jgi:small basic protein
MSVVNNLYRYSFIALLIFHFLLLLFLSNDFSISYKEADIYFNNSSLLLSYISHFSTSIFGQNDIALRLPFILLYIASSFLLYLLTENYFNRKFDQFISIAVFMMLPGVNSAALLVNEAIVVVFLTLLYLYIYKLRKEECYLLLFMFIFIDNSFAILYLALFFRAMAKKDNILIIISLVFFGVSMGMYGFDIGGKPKGYFIDTFGVYGSIFSPLVFLYFFYSIYRRGLKDESKGMFWYISTTALVLSFIFSLRQKIVIEDFAPFVVIGIPIMIKTLMSSIRVRLKEFRKVYYTLSVFIFTVLVLNFCVFFANKYLYIFLQNPKKHFAYNYHVAKQLATKLKEKGIREVSSYDERLQLRLKFYGINESIQYILYNTQRANYREKIEISYKNIRIDTYYVVSKLK